MLSVFVDFDFNYSVCAPAVQPAPETPDGETPPERPLGLSLEQVEMQYIVRLLTDVRWNKSKAASILGIERSTLDRKLQKHGVQRPEQLLQPTSTEVTRGGGKPRQAADEAREWWIRVCNRQAAYDHAMRYECPGYVHVREVLPGVNDGKLAPLPSDQLMS